MSGPVHRSRGVAVIAALLIVALASLAVTGVLWRQQVLARSVENQIALAQSRWLARAAIDWARAILRTDRQNTVVDHKGETWAIPIAETRVDDAQGEAGREAWLSGAMTDEEGKINLLDLATNGVPVDEQVERLRRLLGALDASPSLADGIAEGVAATQARRTADGAMQAASALPWLQVDDLIRVPGIDGALIERLRPHVAFLPRGAGEPPIAVNLNTASPEVLYATIPTLSRSQADAYAAQRDRIYFQDVERALSNLSTVGARRPDNLSGVSVSTRFFRVQGRIRYDRALVFVDALVRRDDSGETRVLWMRER